MKRLAALALLFPSQTLAQDKPYTLGGYGEAYYQWNFNDPQNDITNYRGFDNRHDSFTISNVALDAQWDDANVIGRLTLQVGHTPSTYYGAEPESPGTGGANSSDATLWKYLQQAYVGYRIHDLSITAGLFLSPLGPEALAVKDNWNWSRSNLYFGLPYYHTGVKASYPLTKEWSTTVAGYNGWNSVVDNNGWKSVALSMTYANPTLTFSTLYFGGVERPDSSWRHMLDAHATWYVSGQLALMTHLNSGMESPHNRWIATALYTRLKFNDWLFAAVRGDVFVEKSDNPIFWPSPWVSSGTVTVEIRPDSPFSLKLEYRHDQSKDTLFFGQQDEPTRRMQNTVTVGATSWF